MNKIIMLSGAALLTVAGAALAQPPGGPDGPRRADGPGRDASVTRQQVIERTDQLFARLDANHDGRFTPDEARQQREQRRAERMDRMFERLDLDRNGSITREEMSQARARHQAQRAERGARGPGGPGGPGMGHRGPGMHHRGPGGPGGPEGPGGPGGPGVRGQRLFGEQGFVTREQFRTRALARFDRADADHDGVVTPAERQAARAQMRERRQRPS